MFSVLSPLIHAAIGVTCFVGFWLVTNGLEEFHRWGPFVVGAAVVLIIAAVLSAITTRSQSSSTVLCPLLFASPFILAAVVSAAALPDRDFRPFIFWATTAFLVFAASYGGAYLRRTGMDPRGRSNQSLQPTPGRSDD